MIRMIAKKCVARTMSLLVVILCSLMLAMPVLSMGGCSQEQLATFDNAVTTLENHLPQLAQMATGITALVAPEYATLIAPFAGSIATDAKLLQNIVDGLKVQPNATTMQKIDVLWADVNANLQQIVNAVGVKDPQSTAAANLFAGLAGEIIQFIQDLGNKAPVTARLLLPHVYGWNLHGMHAMAYSTGDKEADAVIDAFNQAAASGTPAKTRPKLNARQIAKAWNAIAKNKPQARIAVPRAHVLGVPVPFTGSK